ncbi:MAG: DsbA family protein, partial [Propionibacteriaceae bacterium]|nr:DsbA family protein [Propionibacteriaceae bacterium]
EFLRVTAAAGAGITGGDLTRFQSCYDDRKYSDFVTGVYDAATQAGITGTPTYQLDGQLVTLYSAESLQADIDSVLAGGAPAANPACSPSDHPDAPPTTLPPNANAKATGIVANPEAPADHVLAVYVDFQCPYCAQAEELSGDVVAEAVAENKVRVEFRTRTFLDQVNQSNTDGTADSSTRAANAAACADLAGVYLPYHKYIFDNQPTEGVGYTDGFLRDVAPAAVGLSGDALATFQQCYDSRQFAEFVSYVDTAAQYACVTGTPTYKLDGEDVSWSDPASLKKSLDAVS